MLILVIMITCFFNTKSLQHDFDLYITVVRRLFILGYCLVWSEKVSRYILISFHIPASRGNDSKGVSMYWSVVCNTISLQQKPENQHSCKTEQLNFCTIILI